MTTSEIELRSTETVLARESAVPVHFQFEGELRAYRMKSDIVLTNERIVGSRSFLTRKQVTPDIDRSRIVQIAVVDRLQIRGISRSAFRGRFLRLEIDDPATTVAFLLDGDVAAAWAAELG